RLLWSVLSDTWTKLALICPAGSRTRMDKETKKTVAKWETTPVRLESKRQLTPEIIEPLRHGDPTQRHPLIMPNQILEKDVPDPVPTRRQRLRTWHVPVGDCTIDSERERENIVAIVNGLANFGRRSRAE